MTQIELVEVQKDEDMQVIIGHASFIKTVEDIYEACIQSSTNILFGLAFVEASGKRLIRIAGNDKSLETLAAKNMQKINAGHSFMIIFKNAYPINVLPHLRSVPEISTIYCASANPISVALILDQQRRGIIGILDGLPAIGIESLEDKKERHEVLRKIEYKL